MVRSRWWERERREESNIPWVTQPAFMLQGISQKEREREKERKDRQARGHKLWWSKGALLNSVRVYIPVVSLDTDQETRLYKFTKEARSNRGHEAKRRSITKEGHKSPLSPKGKANEGNPMQASHLFDLSLISSPWRGLTGNRGLQREMGNSTQESDC